MDPEKLNKSLPLVIDKGDFASGATNRSSRIFHCGLRHLAPGKSVWDLNNETVKKVEEEQVNSLVDLFFRRTDMGWDLARVAPNWDLLQRIWQKL